MSSLRTRKTLAPPDPCSGLMTIVPSSLAKCLISSRSRVISVRRPNLFRKQLEVHLARCLGQAVRIAQHDHAVPHGHPREFGRGRRGPRTWQIIVRGNVAQHQHVKFIHRDSRRDGVLALSDPPCNSPSCRISCLGTEVARARIMSSGS